MNRPQAHIRWVLQLRWVAAACFLTLLVVVEWLYDWWLPRGALVGLVAFTAASGLGLWLWHRQRGDISDGLLAAVLVADIGTLTALLALSNGPLNPFTSLYFIHVAVAALALSPAWVAVVVAVSIGAYGWLYLLHPGAHGGHSGHGDTLQLHLVGMWIAYAFTAPFLALSLHLVRRSLGRYESQLAEAHAASERAQKLASLATLAAGAAHELATPLSTIAVVARELEHRLTARDAVAAEDALLIRTEVERCAAILRQLAVDAGEGRGETPRTFALHALLSRIAEGLPVHIEAPADLSEAELHLPLDLLARALRGLVQNAVLAAPGEVVRLRLHRAALAGPLLLDIVDSGPGIPASVRERLGEPFFTTRPAGQGMGLGVFFARETLRRLGGTLSYPDVPAGTVARIQLPPPQTPEAP